MVNTSILVVDDEPDICNLLKEILEDEGYAVKTAENAEQARKAYHARHPDLVLLDIWMPDTDGISLLKEWKHEDAANPPVIMMSGHGTVETAVEATRLGAYDFIEKPVSLGKLLITIQRALESYRLQQEFSGLSRRASRPMTEVVGHSRIMKQLCEQARRIARHDTPVLIQGEPGSGKGIIARYLHANSPRCEGAFIDTGETTLLGDDPAAILFGSEEEGKVRPGLLEKAGNGSLFLDDIGEMDMRTQAFLLNALETGRYYRIGGSEPLVLETRIIAATHHDLERRLKDGRFRRELYYHLNVVPLQVTPLRGHLEDVPDLLNFFVDYFVAQDKLPYRAFTVAAQNRLRHYSWPGNIRSLKNLVQGLLIVGSGSEIDSDEVEVALATQATITQSGESAIPYELPLRQAREQFERAYFNHLLREMDGSISKVAGHAGIERTHLYRKLRALGIDTKHITGKH